MDRGEFMGSLLLFIAVVGSKILLCKGFSLVFFLLLFWIKGKQLGSNSERWDNFFLQLSPRAVQQYTIAIYITAAVLSSVISYFILEAASCQYSLAIAILLFAGGLAITAYRWHTKGKEHLLKRYQEIPNTILFRRNGEKIENE